MTAIGAALFAAVIDGQVVNRSPNVALYASVGEELITFSVDAARAALIRQSSMTLPGFVQEGWASPSMPFLYIAWSNGGTSYTGSGVAPRGDKHGVTSHLKPAELGDLVEFLKSLPYEKPPDETPNTVKYRVPPAKKD